MPDNFTRQGESIAGWLIIYVNRIKNYKDAFHVGVLTLLKYPYPRDVEEPDQYDSIRVHAEWGKSRDSSVRNQGNLAVS